MSHYNNLVSFIDELIGNYAKYDGDIYELKIYNLSDTDNDKLLALKIEETDRDLTECVNGKDFSLDNAYSCALLKMLQNNTAENRENFAKVVRDNIADYTYTTLQDLIDERCNEYLHEQKASAHMFAYPDRDTGELVWRHV